MYKRQVLYHAVQEKRSASLSDDAAGLKSLMPLQNANKFQLVCPPKVTILYTVYCTTVGALLIGVIVADIVLTCARRAGSRYADICLPPSRRAPTLAPPEEKVPTKRRKH